MYVCMSVCLYVPIFFKKYSTYSKKTKHHNIRCGQAEELQVIFFGNPRWPLKIQNGRQENLIFEIFAP